MANRYDTNLILDRIADALDDNQNSALIAALDSIKTAIENGGGGGGDPHKEIYSKQYSTSYTWANALKDFYTSVTGSSAYAALSEWEKRNLKLDIEGNIYHITIYNLSRFTWQCTYITSSGAERRYLIRQDANSGIYIQYDVSTSGVTTVTNNSASNLTVASTFKLFI